MKRRRRQGDLEDGDLDVLLRVGSILDDRADRGCRGPAIDEPNPVHRPLLDPEPDEARVRRVVEDRPAERVDDVHPVGEQVPDPARHLALQPLAFFGDRVERIVALGSVVAAFLDELDVALERRCLLDLAAERVVGVSVEKAGRQRRTGRRHEDEQDEPEDRGAAVPESAEGHQQRGHATPPPIEAPW